MDSGDNQNLRPLNTSAPSPELADVYEKLGGHESTDADRLRKTDAYIKEVINRETASRERARVFGGSYSKTEIVSELSSQLLPALKHMIQGMESSGSSAASLASAYSQYGKLEKLYGSLTASPSTARATGIDPAMELLRSDVRVLRSRRAMGEDISGTEMFSRVSGQASLVDRRLEELVEKYDEARKNYEGDPSSENLASVRAIRSELSYTSNLKQELMNVIEHGTTKQTSSFNRLSSFVAQMASTLNVASYISQFAITEPYRFGTQPRLQILGQQGQMGSLMSNAMGELASYDYELNQKVFGTGVGALTTGVGMMLSGGVSPIGIGLAAAGGVLGFLGVSGRGDDLLRSAGLSKDQSEILGQSFAKQLANPSALINEFSSSRAGLLAVGGPGANNFGFSTDFSRAPGGTGNTFLDNILGGDTGYGLRAFGYDRTSLGQLLTATSLSLRGPNLERMAGFAGQVGGAYGVGDQAVLAGLQTAQRYGSRDAIASFSRTANVFEENGRIENYSMNVLVPALMKVTESATMRNLARSTEELESEVTNFGRYVFQSDDTRLGQLSRVNPEIIGRMIGGLQESSMMGVNNTSIAALDLMLGSSMADIFLGRASVSARRIDYAINQSGVSAFSGADDLLGNQQGVALMRMLTGLTTGLSPQDLIALTELGVRGQLFDAVTGDFAYGNMPEDLAERLQAGATSPLGELSISMSEQVDEFMVLSSGLIDKLLALQNQITSFMSNDYLPTIIGNFFGETQKELGKLVVDLENMAEAQTTSDLRNNVDVLKESGSYDDFNTRLEGAAGITGFNFLQGAATELFGENTYLSMMGMIPENQELQTDVINLFQNADRDAFNEGLTFLREKYGFSSGGFTGIGGTHVPTGIVHAGEYVISAQNVDGNREVLDRIQSGENVSEMVSSQSSGETTYVTIKIHGMSRDDIVSTARRVTEDYIVRNRLNYT